MGSDTTYPKHMAVSGSRLAWASRGFAALADQGLVSVSGFVVSIMLARWLSPEQYGAYALAFSIFLFVSSFHNALLLEPMSVFGPANYKGHLRTYLATLLRIHVAFSVTISAVLGLFVLVAGRWITNGPVRSALYGFALAAPWILFFWLWRRAAYLQLSPWLAVRGSIGYAFIVALLLVVLHHEGLLGPFSGFMLQAAAGAIATLLLLIALPPAFAAETPRMSSVLHEHWGYGRWVAATAVAYWLSGGAYYVVVGTLLSMRDVAALRALQNITLPFHQFVLAIGLLLLPWASGRYADGGQQGIHRVMRSTTFLYTACAVAYVACIVPFGHHVMHLLYGEKYMAFAYLLPLVCLPLPLSAIAQGPSVALKAMQSPADVFFAYTVSGFFTIAVGVGLTYVWGLVGALIGLALSSLSFLLVLSYRYRVKRAALVDPRPPISSCTREPNAKPSIRVAWLMPMFRYGYYWQPVLREFTRLLPDTLIYTCNWGGYTHACRDTFKVFEVSGTRLTFRRKPSSYDVGLTSAPFSLIFSLLKFRPDLIVTTQFGLWTVFGLIAKLLLRARMILLWDGISPGIACMQSPLRLASRRLLARYFDICVTQTRDAFEYLRDTVDVPEHKIVLRPYEVPDIAVLCADEHICGPADHLPKPLFLYVGSLSERKGVKYLIESVRRLHARNVGSFSVALVGDGDIELLRQIVAKYNLSDHIHFAGRVPYQELGHWFRACDAFVLPTLEDVWGMVVLEAMAFGKPVLCSRHAGSSELVHPGSNGFLFDPLRPIELTALMAHLIEHPQLLGRLGERSKELVASLTPQSSAALLRDLVLRTLGDPPGGQSGLTECHEQAKAVSAD